MNPKIDEYNSNTITISYTLWLPDITDWWHQQEKTDSINAALSDMARDIFCIILNGLGVKAIFHLGPDVNGRAESNPTRVMIQENDVVRRFDKANHH